MSRWLALSVFSTASCLSCVAPFGPFGAPPKASLVQLEDTCGDADGGFAERMGHLASSIWTANVGGGPLDFSAAEVGADTACPIDRYYQVALFPDGGGFVGSIGATAVDRCSQESCQITWMVGGR